MQENRKCTENNIKQTIKRKNRILIISFSFSLKTVKECDIIILSNRLNCTQKGNVQWLHLPLVVGERIYELTDG
jgi:hypothetical protein